MKKRRNKKLDNIEMKDPFIQDMRLDQKEEDGTGQADAADHDSFIEETLPETETLEDHVP